MSTSAAVNPSDAGETASEDKMQRAGRVVQTIFMQEKLTDLEALDVIIRVAVPILCKYPRIMENNFFKTLEKNLKTWRKMVLHKKEEPPVSVSA